jgi:hypothetical protein
MIKEKKKKLWDRMIKFMLKGAILKSIRKNRKEEAKNRVDLELINTHQTFAHCLGILFCLNYHSKGNLI